VDRAPRLGDPRVGLLIDVSYVPGTQTVYASGTQGRVYRSADDGQTWTDVGIDQVGNLPVNAVAFATSTMGYAVTNGARIYTTQNGGGTWMRQTVQGAANEDLFDIVTWGNGDEAVAVGQSGAVFEKTGTSFVKQALGIVVDEHLNDVEQLSDGDVLRLGGEGGVVLFRDGGVWSRPRSRTTQPLYKMSFLSANEGFGIGRRSLILEYDGP